MLPKEGAVRSAVVRCPCPACARRCAACSPIPSRTGSTPGHQLPRPPASSRTGVHQMQQLPSPRVVRVLRTVPFRTPLGTASPSRVRLERHRTGWFTGHPRWRQADAGAGPDESSDRVRWSMGFTCTCTPAGASWVQQAARIRGFGNSHRRCRWQSFRSTTASPQRIRSRPEPRSLTPSCRAYGDPHLVTSTQVEVWFPAQCYPGLDPEQRRDPVISPLYADLAGLPPARFVVGTNDPLLDDTLHGGTLASGGKPRRTRCRRRSLPRFHCLPADRGPTRAGPVPRAPLRTCECRSRMADPPIVGPARHRDPRTRSDPVHQ